MKEEDRQRHIERLCETGAMAAVIERLKKRKSPDAAGDGCEAIEPSESKPPKVTHG